MRHLLLPELETYAESVKGLPLEPCRVAFRASKPVLHDDCLNLDAVLAKAVEISVYGGRPPEYLPNTTYYFPLPLEAAEHLNGLPLWKSTILYPQQALVKAIRLGRGRVERSVEAVEWSATCVGNPTEIRRLLHPVRGVGRRVSEGWGRVSEWIVEPLGRDFDFFDTAGNALRPVPTKRAQGGRVMGWTPPYWRTDLHLPCFAPRPEA